MKQQRIGFVLSACLLVLGALLMMAAPSHAEGNWSAWKPNPQDPLLSFRTKCKYYAESIHAYYWVYQIRNDHSEAKQIEWAAAGTYDECDKMSYLNSANIASGDLYTDYTTGPSDVNLYVKFRVAKP